MIYANTANIFGLHQKVAVTIPGGTLGVSFGMDSPSSSQQGPIESYFERPAFGKAGSGSVYIDDDAITEVKARFKTNADEDKLIAEKFQAELGRTGPYNVYTNSCRTYSEFQYRLMKRMIEQHRKNIEKKQEEEKKRAEEERKKRAEEERKRENPVDTKEKK